MRVFCEHLRIICVGVEADGCNLSGYIHIYINSRTGGILILESTSTKSFYIPSKHCFTIAHVIRTQHPSSIASLLNERPAELPQSSAWQLLDFCPNPGMQ